MVRGLERKVALAGTHVLRLFDHLLESRVVLRCPHCSWTWPAVFKFARFELGAFPNSGVRQKTRQRGRYPNYEEGSVY